MTKTLHFKEILILIHIEHIIPELDLDYQNFYDLWLIKKSNTNIRSLLHLLEKVTLYKTSFPSSLLPFFPQLFSNFGIVILKICFQKIYDHQIWKRGMSTGIDSFETYETSNGNVVTLRSHDY